MECHYGKESKCIVHPDCHWCTTNSKFGKVGDGCFTTDQTKVLPEKIWECTGLTQPARIASDEAEAAAVSVSKPLVECSYGSEAKCVVHPNCEWCETSKKAGQVGDGCFTSKQADLLPESIWSCTNDSS